MDRDRVDMCRWHTSTHVEIWAVRDGSKRFNRMPGKSEGDWWTTNVCGGSNPVVAEIERRTSEDRPPH